MIGIEKVVCNTDPRKADRVKIMKITELKLWILEAELSFTFPK
jgi:hypothetical protein